MVENLPAQTGDPASLLLPDKSLALISWAGAGERREAPPIPEPSSVDRTLRQEAGVPVLTGPVTSEERDSLVISGPHLTGALDCKMNEMTPRARPTHTDCGFHSIARQAQGTLQPWATLTGEFAKCQAQTSLTNRGAWLHTHSRQVRQQNSVFVLPAPPEPEFLN